MNTRVLKFYLDRFLMKKKIVDLYFLCPSYVPFLSYVPLEAKFENIVCKISQTVFELEPPYLVY